MGQGRKLSASPGFVLLGYRESGATEPGRAPLQVHVQRYSVGDEMIAIVEAVFVLWAILAVLSLVNDWLWN